MDHSSLTPREREVLLLLHLGKTNKQVSEELGLSVNTIKTDLKSSFGKLKVTNRTQACLKALDEH